MKLLFLLKTLALFSFAISDKIVELKTGYLNIQEINGSAYKCKISKCKSPISCKQLSVSAYSFQMIKGKLYIKLQNENKKYELNNLNIEIVKDLDAYLKETCLYEEIGSFIKLSLKGQPCKYDKLLKHKMMPAVGGDDDNGVFGIRYHNNELFSLAENIPDTFYQLNGEHRLVLVRDNVVKLETSVLSPFEISLLNYWLKR
jgi:hypothetical protein